MKKPSAVQAAGSARKRIRDAGLRCTDARLSVLEYLDGVPSPQTHAEVAEGLSSYGFDRATIYRNLVELSEAGLLSRVDLGDHVWRFEVRRSGQSHEQDHPHFVCVDCGEVSCLPAVSVSISTKLGAKVASIGAVTEVLLKGHCGQCT